MNAVLTVLLLLMLAFALRVLPALIADTWQLGAAPKHRGDSWAPKNTDRLGMRGSAPVGRDNTGDAA